MQKALLQMNIQLSQALSDVTGETGLVIIRAIVAGERDPLTLARLRHRSYKSSEETIAKALTGNWQDELLFRPTPVPRTLRLLHPTDRGLQRRGGTSLRRHPTPLGCPRRAARDPPGQARLQVQEQAKPADSTRAELFRIAGVDLVAVDGISASLAQIILSETGTDISPFPTEKRFCSWLRLAPHNDISGGKVLRSRTLKSDNRAGRAFLQAAASVTRSDCAFGAFCRHKCAQIGPMQVLVATAHKIARTVYFMLKHKVAYHDIGAQGYETRQRERQLATLRRKAAKLGFDLTPQAAPNES